MKVTWLNRLLPGLLLAPLLAGCAAGTAGPAPAPTQPARPIVMSNRTISGELPPTATPAPTMTPTPAPTFTATPTPARTVVPYSPQPAAALPSPPKSLAQLRSEITAADVKIHQVHFTPPSAAPAGSRSQASDADQTDQTDQSDQADQTDGSDQTDQSDQ